MDDDEKFDYLRERSPEQEAAADETEPHVEDDSGTHPPVRGEDAAGERARTAQPGL